MNEWIKKVENNPQNRQIIALLDKPDVIKDGLYTTAHELVQRFRRSDGDRPVLFYHIFNATFIIAKRRIVTPEAEYALQLWYHLVSECLMDTPLTPENVNEVLPRNDAAQARFWAHVKNFFFKIQTESLKGLVKLACEFIFYDNQFQAPPTPLPYQAIMDSMGLSNPFDTQWERFIK
jgi:hypothetical protein